MKSDDIIVELIEEIEYVDETKIINHGKYGLSFAVIKGSFLKRRNKANNKGDVKTHTIKFIPIKEHK